MMVVNPAERKGPRVGDRKAVLLHKVIGQGDEIVTALFIQSADLLRWLAPVGAGRVCVKISFPEAAGVGEWRQFHSFSNLLIDGLQRRVGGTGGWTLNDLTSGWHLIERAR